MPPIGSANKAFKQNADGSLVVDASVSIDTSDLEIGAVELKNGTTDDRAVIDTSGALLIKDTNRRTAGVDTTVGVTTSSATVLAASATRKAIFIQNISDTDVWLTFTGTATTSSGFKVVAGGSFFLDICVPTSAIKGIHGGSGTKNITVLEG